MFVRAANIGRAFATAGLIIFAPSLCIASSLRVAVPNSVKTLNPLKTTVTQENFVLSLVYSSLFRKDLNGNIIPVIASRWTVNERGKSIKIWVKNNEVFSDGTPVKAHDIQKSLELICQNNGKFVHLQSLSGCDGPGNKKVSVKVINDYHLLLKSRFSASYLLDTLASGVAPVFKFKGQRAIGSGPFIAKALKRNVITLQRRDALEGHYNEIQFSKVHQQDLWEELKKNSIDVASMYFGMNEERTDKLNYFQQKHAASIVNTLILNPSSDEFSNIRIRRRVRDLIIKEEFFSCKKFSRPIYGFIPKGVGGALGKNEIARGPLIKKNSINKNIVYIHTIKDRVNHCEKDKLLKIFSSVGLRMKLVEHDSYKEFDPVVLGRKISGLIDYYVFNSRDASNQLKNLSPKNKENFFLTSYPEIDNLLRMAWRMPHVQDRFETYKMINKSLFQDSSILGLYALGHVNLLKKCFRDNVESVTGYNMNSFLMYLKNIKLHLGCGK